ncbi:YceI family protein [Chryseolinea sp. T2]|uniref:YceI family protein n=1 Tax=Chryseolinea sp. T2 TaxID=3129255 RepID=UPI00307871E2
MVLNLGLLLRIPVAIGFLFFTIKASGQQRYFAEKPSISFFSDGLVEDITAANQKVTSIFDALNGEIAFLMNVKDFQFANKLMQTHFNEKYMESETYPKSSFQGKVTGFNANSSGTQQVKAVGKLTIHGVTREIDVPGTIEVNGGKLKLKAKFLVKLEDYKIVVPQVVWDKIAQQVEVTLDFAYRPL